MARDLSTGQERRQYIRLDTVFPVLFRLESIDETSFLSGWQQGFTNDVGKGGICLSVNNFDPESVRLLRDKDTKLSLEIELPIGRRPVAATAHVVWVKEVMGAPNKYIIGLNYDKIEPRQNRRIMRYARLRQIFLPFSLAIILLLGLAFLMNSYSNSKLIEGNKALIAQLVKIAQESSIAKQKVKQISKEREDLQIKIQVLEQRIQAVEEERVQSGERLRQEKLEERDKMISELTAEKEALEKQLILVQQKESLITEELLRLDKRKVNLEKENFDKMYQWLKVHQNTRTGLIMSFEGDRDISGWAFIYDQSLAAQAYTYFSDFQRAKKIFDFFENKAQRENGQFFNGYYVSDGSPAEYAIHSGPNIWVGIAIMHYTQKSQDKSYLGLAEEIAQKIMALQSEDAEAGIRGGPNQSWYSTEHNLDAYAFFNMLYKITAKEQYKDASEKALKWLMNNTYNKEEVLVQRGRGDSTIATDTYAWSIAAIGPEKLEESGMNPDRILEFAEQNCSVEVDYTRPEGQTIKIKGFDFAPQTHLARGGVISTEWTAQMVIAFKVMADFYYKRGLIAKSRGYAFKADEYLLGLAKLIISSPSPSGQGEGCIPYSTLDNVDTGHGWFTPKGKYTGSVAATAYTLFAYYNYNPLELKE